MTIRVQGPDGVVIEFPAGTPDDVMSKALTTHYGQKPVAQGPGLQGAQGGETVRADAAGDTRTLPQIRDEYVTAQGKGDRTTQQGLASAYVNKERKEGGLSYALTDRARQMAKGVPLIGKGLDEFSAFMSSPIDGKGYEESLDYQRARDKTFEDARPKESMALGLTGGIASGIAAAPALAGVIGSAATRGGAVLRGAATGAGIGAVDGFVDGENGFVNRAEKSALGGVIGGAVGAAAVPFVAGVSKGINSIAETLARRSAPTGMSPQAGQVLQRTLDNDGMLGPAGGAALAKSGPSGMIADVSPGTMSLLDTAMQRGGRSTSDARKAIEGRATAANQSVDDAMNSALGAPRGVATADEGIRTGTQPARSSAYDAAYAAPIDYAAPQAQAIEGLLSRVPGSAIAAANQELRMLGHQSKQIMADIADDGAVKFHQMPDVQQIDAITRVLQGMARTGDGKGLMGGNTPTGRAAGNLAGEIRDNLRQLVPQYGQALDTAADAIGRREALDVGRRALSPAMARDEFGMTLNGMGQAERAEVSQGVRSQIDETLANVRSAISDPNVDARQAVSSLNQFSSDAVREKVTALVGKDQAAPLFSALDEARRALSLRAGVSQNSKTFARQSMTDQIEQSTAPGPVGTFIAGGEQGGLSQGIRALARTMMGKTPQRLQSEQDAIYGDVVKALTGPRGADAQSLIAQLSRRGELEQSNDTMARAGGLLLGGAATGGAYQASRPRQPMQR